MNGDLVAAIGWLREEFARYPRLAVLDGCPHCRGRVTVDDHDLYSLTISLGNTVGDEYDVKSLLPLLLERLVTSGEIDAAIVLGKLPQQRWRTWPAQEQAAVDCYLDAVWRCLLARWPSTLGSFVDAATFLEAVAAAGECLDRFLVAWDATPGSAADQHLAELVNGLDLAVRRPRAMDAWVRRDTVRDRLYQAFQRDHRAPWADDLARAYDLARGW